MRTDLDSRTHAAIRTRSPCGSAAVAGLVALALVTLALVAPAAPTAHSRSLDAQFGGVPVEQLKQIYLSCDRAAAGARLSTEGVWQCSIVYEELKRRAFGGDFDRMRAWSRANPSVPGPVEGP